MALRRLHNEDWGFETNCFVCEPRNAGGLRIPFHHDDDLAAVVATFSLDATFSGAPSYVHGGVSLAVLDEAQAWATIALGGKLAVTAETTTRFERPVLVGETYRVEARLTDQDDARITTEGQILDQKGRACAISAATFVVLGAAQAVEATGATADAIDPDLLR
jgi:uncharacterized protein (TIGR00369 family)